MEKTAKQLAKKQQEIKDDKVTEEMNRLRSIASDKLIPLLKEKSENVEEAKMVTSALAMAIQQGFINKQAEIKVKDLGLRELIDPKDEFQIMRDVLTLIEEETIVNALKVIEKFPQYVDAAIKKEMQTRKLSDLNLGIV